MGQTAPGDIQSGRAADKEVAVEVIVKKRTRPCGATQRRMTRRAKGTKARRKHTPSSPMDEERKHEERLVAVAVAIVCALAVLAIATGVVEV